MPGILFRHIFVELVKVLVVTTAVLVTVIAFGAAIKPLAENLLSPADLLRYILYATIPMMQFALPFAAAFAGTIVYHRLSTDNEIVAMAACGISYRRIMLPAVMLGVVLTGAMLVLVDVGVPTFWQALKRIAARDSMRLLAAQVARGEAFVPEFSDMEIYADEAILTDAPTDTGAAQRLLLVGVAAVRFDQAAAPVTEFTAQSATVDVHRVGENSFLKPVLSNATVFNRGDNSIAKATIVRPEAVDLGRSFEQGPKGMSFAQLWALRTDQSEFAPIVALRETLLGSLDSVDAWRWIADTIASGQPLILQGTGDAESIEYEVLAGGLDGTTLRPRADGSVTIRQSHRGPDGPQLRAEITAPSATLSLGEVRADGTGRFDVLAESALVRDPRAGGRGVQRRMALRELQPVGLAAVDRAGLGSAELVTVSRQELGRIKAGPVDAIGAAVAANASELATQLGKLQDEIIARIVQRTSQAMTAFLMLLTGAVLAVLLRQRTPLFVYLLAFIPAIIDILLISGGEQMLRRGFSPAALVVAFGGNAVLGLVCLWGAWRVGKH